MSKKEKHKQDLIGLFGTFFETGDVDRLTEYIVLNSNLPGPRGNLELAGAFADVVGRYPLQIEWKMCQTAEVLKTSAVFPRKFGEDTWGAMLKKRVKACGRSAQI